MSMSMDESTPNQFKISATAKNKRSLLCTDYVFFANTEVYHYEELVMAGSHEWTFTIPT